MMHKVVVTGVGPVSAIGCGRNEFWDALTAGQHGFGPITLCDSSASPSKIAAEVKDFGAGRYVAHGDIMARRTPRTFSWDSQPVCSLCTTPRST